MNSVTLACSRFLDRRGRAKKWGTEARVGKDPPPSPPLVFLFFARLRLSESLEQASVILVRRHNTGAWTLVYIVLRAISQKVLVNTTCENELRWRERTYKYWYTCLRRLGLNTKGNFLSNLFHNILHWSLPRSGIRRCDICSLSHKYLGFDTARRSKGTVEGMICTSGTKN